MVDIQVKCDETMTNDELIHRLQFLENVLRTHYSPEEMNRFKAIKTSPVDKFIILKKYRERQYNETMNMIKNRNIDKTESSWIIKYLSPF